MSKTLRISDGDMVINTGTGVPDMVTKLDKAGQDVARHILGDFSSFFNEGNELMQLNFGALSGVSEALITQFLVECVNRLIIKQRDSNSDERIIKVNQVQVRVVSMTIVVFLVEVLFESGEVISVVDQVSVKRTSLDHQLDPSAFLNV